MPETNKYGALDDVQLYVFGDQSRSEIAELALGRLPSLLESSESFGAQFFKVCGVFRPCSLIVYASRIGSEQLCVQCKFSPENNARSELFSGLLFEFGITSSYYNNRVNLHCTRFAIHSIGPATNGAITCTDSESEIRLYHPINYEKRPANVLPLLRDVSIEVFGGHERLHIGTKLVKLFPLIHRQALEFANLFGAFDNPSGFEPFSAVVRPNRIHSEEFFIVETYRPKKARDWRLFEDVHFEFGFNFEPIRSCSAVGDEARCVSLTFCVS